MNRSQPDAPDIDAVRAVPGARWHDYGKAPRPGRKLGHATVVSGDAATRDHRAATLSALADASAR